MAKDIPYGYCHCGCGEKAPIAKKTRNPIGHKKGQPIRFIRGHHGRRSVAARAWTHINVGHLEDCWEWTGRTSTTGQGRIVDESGRHTFVHRWMYGEVWGAISSREYVDQVCGQPLCVNPFHLRAVARAQGHCEHGHALSGENLYITPDGRRRCRACSKKRSQQYWIRATEGQRENGRRRAREWTRNNTERIRLRYAFTSHRRRGAPLDDVAREYARSILLYDVCSYCGSTATHTVDHIVSIVDGGDSHWSNLTNACGSCNSSKGDKDLLSFLLYRKDVAQWRLASSVTTAEPRGHTHLDTRAAPSVMSPV